MTLRADQRSESGISLQNGLRITVQSLENIPIGWTKSDRSKQYMVPLDVGPISSFVCQMIKIWSTTGMPTFQG